MKWLYQILYNSLLNVKEENILKFAILKRSGGGGLIITGGTENKASDTNITFYVSGHQDGEVYHLQDDACLDNYDPSVLKRRLDDLDARGSNTQVIFNDC